MLLLYFILFEFFLNLCHFNGASGTRFRARKIPTSLRLAQNVVVSAKASMSSSAATKTSPGSESLKAYGSEQIQASNWEFQILSQMFLRLMCYCVNICYWVHAKDEHMHM